MCWEHIVEFQRFQRLAFHVLARKLAMARHLFIVSRDHAGLQVHLQERFKGDDKVEVIVDRRSAERRRTAADTRDPERRRADRRANSEVDVELRTRSHVVVTVPEPDGDA